jgi:hypothetical protein
MPSEDSASHAGTTEHTSEPLSLPFTRPDKGKAKATPFPVYPMVASSSYKGKGKGKGKGKEKAQDNVAIMVETGDQGSILHADGVDDEISPRSGDIYVVSKWYKSSECYWRYVKIHACYQCKDHGRAALCVWQPGKQSCRWCVQKKVGCSRRREVPSEEQKDLKMRQMALEGMAEKEQREAEVIGIGLSKGVSVQLTDLPNFGWEYNS